MPNNGFLKKLERRELMGDPCLQFQRNQHVSAECIRRLGLEAELEGHQGCVNCLSWNEDGSLLVSGSDDVQLIIWRALMHKPLTSIRTGHTGNIFSAKFMPLCRDNIVVSGAADTEIRVHDVESKETLLVTSCHHGRVKRIAVTRDQPHVFWSASEDGTVGQFDLRDPDCFKSQMPRCVLINLNHHVGLPMEIKCLSINPAFSEQLAIGANDPYVRLYDRRMLKCSPFHFDRFSPPATNDDLPRGCVRYYVAGHLPGKLSDYKRLHRTLASTYVTFSPNGQELLVNLGGEHIYLFDVNNERRRQRIDSLLQAARASNVAAAAGACSLAVSAAGGDGNGLRQSVHLQTTTTNGFSHGLHSNGMNKMSPAVTEKDDNNFCSSDSTWCENNSSDVGKVSSSTADRVEEIRKRAKKLFEKQKYSETVGEYNEAILVAPCMSVLYCNRAVALFKRNWDGDIYAAMRDCFTAIRLDDKNLKAHFRLAKCFIELSWLEEARKCLEVFQLKFPSSHALGSLEGEIKNIVKNKKSSEESSSSSSSSATSSSFRLRDLNAATSSSSSSASSDNLSDNEKIHREQAFDYEQRFCGHCNTTTDIKEANFFGSNGQYIVAGSDDGCFFVWDRKSSNVVKAFVGDESIVNCLEPHPTDCLLATSGIEPVVRLWSPRSDSEQMSEKSIEDLDEVAKANQLRMNKDPLEQMLLNMGYRITSSDRDGREGDEAASQDSDSPITCRTS